MAVLLTNNPTKSAFTVTALAGSHSCEIARLQMTYFIRI
jgi:hypothetical protein